MGPALGHIKLFVGLALGLSELFEIFNVEFHIELLHQRLIIYAVQEVAGLRKGSAECFQQKIPPRRNLVLLIPPEAIFGREQFEKSVVEKMDELAIYFRSLYIEKPIVNKKPHLPIEMWNQYDAAGEGGARTTSSLEGWHYGLQA